MQAIIVDDELKSREGLKMLIETFCDDVQVSATCQSITEAMEAINRLKPDIVFLDVRMQGETGFDLLRRMPAIDFEVIFTTAYSEYALNAIKFSAIDYLLKPIDVEELQNAIRKVKGRQKNDIIERMQLLLQNTKGNSSEPQKLALPTAEGLLFIKTNDILYLKASGSYTEFFMKEGTKHLVSRNLKEYDSVLANYSFFRIHHSTIINIDFVKNYVRGDGGYVVMNDGSILDVSRRKKDNFLERMGYKA